MSRSQRDKGARGEREAAELLRAIFPKCRRRCSGDESCERQGVDLLHTPGFAVQVKYGGCPNPLQALREATSAAGPHETPLALVKLCRRGASEEWVACLPAAKLLELLAAAPQCANGAK